MDLNKFFENRPDYIRKFKLFKEKINKNNPVIFEVGAHYGEDSIRLLMTFPNADIYCFEPDNRNIQIFDKYIYGLIDQVNKKYSGNGKIKLYPFALSNKNEKDVIFYYSYDEDYNDSVLNKYFWIDSKLYFENKLNRSGASSLKNSNKYNQGETKTYTYTLDSWIKHENFDEIDLLWIDTQGSEKEVIEGAKETLKKVRFIWLECGVIDYDGAMSKDETINYLSKLGFLPIHGELDSTGEVGDLLFERLDKYKIRD